MKAKTDGSTLVGKAGAVRNGQNLNGWVASDVGEVVRKHAQIHAAVISVAQPWYFGISAIPTCWTITATIAGPSL
jgi:hypothetical protein